MSFVRKRRFAKKPVKRTITKYRRRRNYKPYAKLYRSIRAVSRKVAGEVFKFESTPDMYKNLAITSDGSEITTTVNQPLLNILSGQPWTMPLNWIYQGQIAMPAASIYVNGIQYTATNYSGPDFEAIKNPIYRNN